MLSKYLSLRKAFMKWLAAAVLPFVLLATMAFLSIYDRSLMEDIISSYDASFIEAEHHERALMDLHGKSASFIFEAHRVILVYQRTRQGNLPRLQNSVNSISAVSNIRANYGLLIAGFDEASATHIGLEDSKVMGSLALHRAQMESFWKCVLIPILEDISNNRNISQANIDRLLEESPSVQQSAKSLYDLAIEHGDEIQEKVSPKVGDLLRKQILISAIFIILGIQTYVLFLFLLRRPKSTDVSYLDPREP